MTSIEVPQVSLQRYVELLKRRRWQVIPVSLIGLLIGGLVAFFIPRYYVAETLIEHQPVPGQTSANADDPFQLLVNAAYHTIPLAVGDAMDDLHWPEARAVGYERQEAERLVRDRVKVYDVNAGQASRREYMQIRVTYKDRDGQRSADFLNALVASWVRTRIEEMKVPAERARDQAAERVRTFRQDQEALLNEKRALELQYRIDPTKPDPLLVAQFDIDNKRLADLRDRHDAVEREVAAMRQVQQSARDVLAGIPPRVKEDLADLLKRASESEAGKLLTQQMIYYRRVLDGVQPGTGAYAEAKRNIADCEKRLQALIGPQEVDADGLVSNRAYESLQKEIAAREAVLAAKAAELEKYRQQLERDDARFAGVTEGYARHHRTVKRLAEIEEDLKHATDDLRSAETVLSTLGKTEPVRARFKATPPPRPTDPNILLVALLGCVLGLGLAIGLILMLDVVQGTFKTIDDVERGLPVPVLGGMSHLETEFEREQVARKRRRVSIAAAGFVFLCVAVVAIFYVDATRLPPVVRDLLTLLLGRT